MSTDEPPILEQVRRRLKRWRASAAGNLWVVAVSGGSDSVGLLRILLGLAPELGLNLSVAHLDHGVRADAAREDARFVEELAKRLTLPFDLGSWQPARSGHFEADARRARYAWLHEVANARGASAIAVGHTRDDQAETILHRIVRGTGLRGLAGMPRRRVLSSDPPLVLVRPLLSIARQDIRAYLQTLGQDFRDDATNADMSRTRARIRHDLLPRLVHDYNPRVDLALVRLGMLAAASEGAMENRLRALGQFATMSVSHDQAELRRDRLLQLPMYLRAELLRRVWRQAGWPEAGMTTNRWKRLASLSRSGRINNLAIGDGIELSTTGPEGWPPNSFMLRRVSAVPPSPRWPARMEDIPLEVPGCATWHDGVVSTVLEADDASDERIDLDRLVLPLSLRAPVPGDRFDPLGMGGKNTPLNDFLRSRGAGREARASTPLLCDALGIVWVVGHRIAERVKLSPQTRRTLGLRWEPGSGQAD
jgi:tRNA(Ile)-lysidine synthase